LIIKLLKKNLVLRSILIYLKKNRLVRLALYRSLYKKNYKNFFNLNLDRNSTVIDLGDNVGDISQCLYDLYGCNLHCYEPNIYAYEILKKRFIKKKKILVHNKAISKKNTKSKLYYHSLNYREPIKYSTGSSLSKHKDNINKETYQFVKTISIKDLLNKFNIIDLIKIDIEGYEYEILPFILKNKNKIKKVICELHGNPAKRKNIFLAKKYLQFIKKLKKIDPKKKWFVYHH